MIDDRSFLTGLTEALDVIILQRMKDSQQSFRLIGSIPEWFRMVTDTSHVTEADVQLYLHRPFLQHFLTESHEFWDTHSFGQLASGLWAEQGPDGQDFQFEAHAVAQDDVKFLLIQRIGSENLGLQSVLQTARESGLQHHQALSEHKQFQQVLGGQLERSERLRDDLVMLLDRLQVGTIMTDGGGRVTFLSRVAQQLLKTTEESVAGQPWCDIQVFSAEDILSLQNMLRRPINARLKVPVMLELGKGRRVSLEIDIQDDPRNTQRTIFFLYDVTEVQDLRGLLTEKSRFFDLVGKSSVMTEVYRRIQDIAPVDATVLIQGETGTGKELVARALHQASSRKDGPFIAVNCAGLTDSLLGSQLFGHKRGAFTGASHDHQGFFEAANTGTLFLDEIGDMPLSIQKTLLRVLQEKEITRLGESHPRKVDVRVVTATHQNLEELVKTREFRSDLLYRVRVARLYLPALRDRREDISLLAEMFFGQSRTETKKFGVQEISPEAMQALIKYRWPGNVRELRSALDYALIHCHGSMLQVSDLPPECLRHAEALSVMGVHSELDEKGQIIAALKCAKGKRAEAARLLGMSRSTLYRRLESLGLPLKG